MFCARQSDTPKNILQIVRYVRKPLRSSYDFCYGFHNESLLVLVVHNSILQGSSHFFYRPSFCRFGRLHGVLGKALKSLLESMTHPPRFAGLPGSLSRFALKIHTRNRLPEFIPKLKFMGEAVGYEEKTLDDTILPCYHT
jgi:hypothetical protein